MGILDSSILFLPFGNDLLLVVLTAREPDRFWLYAIAAGFGSLLGCAVTDLLSRRLGAAGLEKMVPKQKMDSAQQKLKKHTFWALGIAALMPPPFPFTVFVMAASALQISRWRVLTAVGVARFVRYFALALIATKFGTYIIRISERDEIRYFVIALAVISIVGSAFSVYKWLQSSRGRGDTRSVSAAEA
jgi:membrane protein YqaA with SNARE-associated domain